MSHSHREPLLATAWGVALASAKPPSANYLRSLIRNPETAKEVLARTALFASVHSEKDYERVLDECRALQEPWTEFVATAATDDHVPRFDRLSDFALRANLSAADNAATEVARPKKSSTLPSAYKVKAPNDYKLKSPPKKLYLVELLGKKNAALYDKSLDSAPASKPVSVPKSVPISSGVSRMLGRHTRPSAMASASAFAGNEPLVSLNSVRKIRAGRPIQRAVDTSTANASARIRELRKQSNRKTITVMDDVTALPPPPDSLRARHERELEDRRKKAELEAAKKMRKDARDKLLLEKAKRKAAKKKAVTREHRSQMRQYREEYDTDEDEEDDVVPISSSDESPRRPRRLKRLQRNGEDPDFEVEIPSKKTRHTFDANERVPRRKGEPTGTPTTPLQTESPPSARHEGHWEQSPGPRSNDLIDSPGRSFSHSPGQSVGNMNSPYGGRRAPRSPRRSPARSPYARPYRSRSRSRSRSPHQRAGRYGGNDASFKRVPVIAPEAMKEETLRRRRSAVAQRGVEVSEVETDIFRQAVGQQCNALTMEDRKQIIEFLDSATDHTKFFEPDEKEKTYVLHEEGIETLVLKTLRDGSWHRVRMRNALDS